MLRQAEPACPRAGSSGPRTARLCYVRHWGADATFYVGHGDPTLRVSGKGGGRRMDRPEAGSPTYGRCGGRPLHLWHRLPAGESSGTETRRYEPLACARGSDSGRRHGLRGKENLRPTSRARRGPLPRSAKRIFALPLFRQRCPDELGDALAGEQHAAEDRAHARAAVG